MPLPAPVLGLAGLTLVVMRLGLLHFTGPSNPLWVDQTLRLEWWVMQPALWLAVTKQAKDLESEAVRLRWQEEAAQAAARQAGRSAAAGFSAGVLGLATAVAVAGSRLPQDQAQPVQPHVFHVSATPTPHGAKSGSTQRLAAFVGGAVCSSLALAGAARRRPKFRDDVHRELLPHCTRRTVTVECPGVLRVNVVVNVLPRVNGAEVSLTRAAGRGLPAADWRKTYSFPWKEGTYECRQESLLLENGVLTLVFEADEQRERIIRVPQPAPALAFSMAGGDIPTPCANELQEPIDGRTQDSSPAVAGCSVFTEESAGATPKLTEASSGAESSAQESEDVAL